MLTLIIALQLAGTISAPPVLSSPALTSCRVADVLPSAAVSGGAKRLMAVCVKWGAPFGAASRYRAITNPVTGSMLVVPVRGGRTEVLLASPTSGGVAVDDVTRDLARMTGRFGDLGLESFAVDASRFAVDGSVGVAATGGTRWLGLAAYAARAAKIVATALPSGISTAVPSSTTTSTGAPQ